MSTPYLKSGLFYVFITGGCIDVGRKYLNLLFKMTSDTSQEG